MFAIQDIPKGRVVWLFDPFHDEVTKEVNTFTHTFGYKPIGWPVKNEIILPADGAMFINHSSAPNIGSANPRISLALRDIKAGEELTENYFDFNETPPL